MSYVSGTGLISGGGGGSSTSTSVSITIDHEAVIKNTDDIASLTSVINNLTTNDIPEGSGGETDNLYYTEQRVDDNIALKTTDDLTEGTNLYYTEQRVDDNIALKTTDDLTEGTNLYYTEQRVNANIALKTTDDLTEGTNLYYTEQRVDDNIALKTTDDLTEGTNLYYTEQRVDDNIALKTTDDITEGTEKLYYTDDKVESYLQAEKIYTTLKKDNDQEILLNGSPNPSYAGNTFNLSLNGMQMNFDLLNNITKTLTFEANNENITIHSANFILGSTLPDGNIKTHITINNNAIDIDRILCYTTFTDAQGDAYITDANGNEIDNPAYISAVPTNERIIIDFKMQMWFLNALIQDMMNASGAPSAYDVVSGVFTFGSVLVDIHQYAMQYSAAAGNVATATIDTGKEVVGTFFEVLGDIFTNKPPTLEELVAEIMKDLNKRSQSYSVKKVGDDFYTGIGDKIKDYAQGNNSFKSIHFNKSGFREPIYTPDINFGSFVNDTSGFNLFPATTSLVAFKNAYDSFVASKNAQIATINSSISAIELNLQPLQIPKTFTITLLDISPFNNYNLYFQGEDRNNVYTDVSSPLDFQLYYSDGDTLIINTGNIKDLLGYGSYENIFFYICIDGVNISTWFNGDGLSSITFILDRNKLYQFKAGYYDSLYNEYIIYTNQLNISSSFNTTFYTKTQIDNKNYLTEHQSLELYALKTEINTYGDTNVLNYLTNNNYAKVSQLNTYGDDNVLTYLTDNNYAKVSQLNTYGDDNVLTYLTDNNYATVSQLNTYGDDNVLTYLTDNNYITSSALDNIDLTNYAHKKFLFSGSAGDIFLFSTSMPFSGTDSVGKPLNTQLLFTGNDRTGEISYVNQANFYKNDIIKVYDVIQPNYNYQGDLTQQYSYLIYPDGSLLQVIQAEPITLDQPGNYGWVIKDSIDNIVYYAGIFENIFIVEDKITYSNDLLPILTYGDSDVLTYLNTNNYITTDALTPYSTTEYINNNFNKYDDTDVNTLLSTKG